MTQRDGERRTTEQLSTQVPRQRPRPSCRVLASAKLSLDAQMKWIQPLESQLETSSPSEIQGGDGSPINQQHSHSPWR